MELNEALSEEQHLEQIQSSSDNMDPIPVSQSNITILSKSPRSPKSPLGKHGSNKGSPIKLDSHSHSGRDGRPKKGGSGRKGAWGGLPDTGDEFVDPNVWES